MHQKATTYLTQKPALGTPEEGGQNTLVILFWILMLIMGRTDPKPYFSCSECLIDFAHAHSTTKLRTSNDCGRHTGPVLHHRQIVLPAADTLT